MVVQHNMAASNANRQLGISTNTLSKSAQTHLANQQRSYLLVIESTVQQMMQQVSQFQRR